MKQKNKFLEADEEHRFAISKDLTADTTFNLTCAAGSGAPATINTDLSKGVKGAANNLFVSAGLVGISAMLTTLMLL